MPGGKPKLRWRVLRYSFGGALCLMAVIDSVVGARWSLALAVAVVGGVILIGQRRILRAAVSRTGDEIVCRYIPWYEGSAYTVTLLLLLMGVAMVDLGFAPGNPAWLRYGGFLLLSVTPLTVWGVVRMWRRCLLRFGPRTLTVRLVDRGSELTEIRRELVHSIEPKIVPNGVSGQSLQVEIAYRAADLTSKTVLLGLQLSVQPINLFHALLAWKDGAADAPSELLDRVERILRGHSTADV
ncbi:hypothetical protein A5646_18995 [Mycobacterium sp. 1245499.0]|uniref:hypothetical protein n=1 Tax=Mycobacterium sp. 1245499.0 TaxID=1834074 RepID=UPI000800AB3E|nr:hypothetical protein [Mycobacterium sp. 1245499.0]OBL01707.1 hypothetical protein A5646_18995 [Mycobacterium sp. 1245499.0]